MPLTVFSVLQALVQAAWQTHWCLYMWLWLAGTSSPMYRLEDFAHAESHALKMQLAGVSD
jgi:hypothetical protein